MAASHPLTGLTVLVTRPTRQAAGLRGLIESAGGRALHLPLLEIVPVTDGGAAAELLARRDFWDWLIFVSANAVRFALPIGDWAGKRSSRTRVAAVGEATAKVLAGAGIRVDLIPKPQFNSESLLAAPEMDDVAGRRILIVRGVGGREHLASVLRQRGAETAYAELYRRVPPAADPTAAIELWRRGGIGAVLLTSGEALDHLMELLGNAGAELALRTPLVVIGARLAERARQRGWCRIAVAEQASDPGLMEALIRLNREGGSPAEPDGVATISEPNLENIH
jgi:uroporphyrinogen-III synthase